MEISFGRALWRNFLGQSPDWYKLILLVFLVVIPLLFYVNPFVAGWLLVAEFIFTLAMALKCYPLLPGGLLAFEAVVIGMTSAEHVKAELASNLEVLLLLIFMVAGIYFMKQLLLFIFTRLLLSIPSKTVLSLAFCLAAAFLSAFLDALTVVAVVISVAVGFYGIYHRVASSRPGEDLQDDRVRQCLDRKILLEALVPAEGLVDAAGVLTDALFVVDVERGGHVLDDLLGLLFGQKRSLFHNILPSRFYSVTGSFRCNSIRSSGSFWWG